FRQALFVDLADMHGNTADGVHTASAGGVWATVVFGFAGMFDSGTSLSFAPRLPDAWESISFRVTRHGSRLYVELDAKGATITVVEGAPVPVVVGADVVEVLAGESVTIPTATLPD